MLKELSGKEETSELLAIIEMREDRLENVALSSNPFIVLFDRPSNKGNLGTMIRSCDALGVDMLIITGHAVDLYEPDVIVSAMGSFFNLPVRIVHPITFSGEVDEQDRMLNAGFDAPYIMQGNKVLEKTSLSLNIDGESRSMSLNAVSQLDHKNGDILFILNGNATGDRLDSDISWQYDREKNFSGRISLSSLLGYNKEKKMINADIDVNPTVFTVNDTVWNIAPSKIIVDGKRIAVKDVDVYREGQFIKAEGVVSDSYDDALNLHLKSIDLGYVFETLNINHVAFSGIATGDFYASGLFTSAPQLNTSNLNVKNFAYHNALLGEADIKSSWDNENKGIVINADIHQYNQHKSFVRGVVYPTRDSLDFKFAADRLNVQILKPFMAAFTSEISGEASGLCELYGTFKLLNIKGRMFAEDFKMKVDYTNTYYTVSDSVILDPGLITIREALVRDAFGNTAKVQGTVRHDYFKNARFDFAITDVDNMLCYDTNEKINILKSRERKHLRFKTQSRENERNGGGRWINRGCQISFKICCNLQFCCRK